MHHVREDDSHMSEPEVIHTIHVIASLHLAAETTRSLKIYGINNLTAWVLFYSTIHKCSIIVFAKQNIMNEHSPKFMT